MARSEFARVAFAVGEEPDPSPLRDSDTPFRMLLMGDFSGRASRGVCDPALQGRRPIFVDRDNFDQVMEKTGVELPPLRFRELDDFHPDALYRCLPLFRAIREAPAPPAEPPAAPAPSPAPAEDLSGLSAAEVFSRMLDEAAPETAAAPRRAPDAFERLLGEIVAPHLEPRPDPRVAERRDQQDAAIAARMRAILHHPEFQAVESAWRALFFLVRRMESDTGLKLYILDISKAELAPLAEAAALSSTPLYDLLVERSVGTPGAEPWAVLAGDYTFDNSPSDIALVRALARIARAAGAPFLAGAAPRVLGCESVAASPDPRSWQPSPDADAAWQALRRSPEAEWVGLALPRFLLRLPYGRGAAGTESFAFEEMPGIPAHEDYLWGNPVFACLELLARGFSRYGWEFRPDAFHEVEDLPAHVFRENGESVLKPCAEALLTDRAALAIAEKGLMAWLSVKGGDSIRLMRFQSIAEPPAALPGRWQ